MAPPDDKDFARALKREDEALQRDGMPATVDRALREKLADPPRRARWPLLLVPLAAALLVFLFWPADRIVYAPHAGAQLAQEDGVTRVVSGVVDVSVVKGTPVRVKVSHGVIEVRGTRFTITQRATDGEVTLHEGSIAFIFTDGSTELLKPGQTLRWPRVIAAPPFDPEPAPAPVPAPEPAPAPAPAPDASSAPTPVVRRPPVTDAGPVLTAEAVLDRLAALRSQGAWGQAVVELEAALAAPLPVATKERLSFELGSILSDHLDDRRRACQRWQLHGKLFPRGRYAAEVAAVAERLKCEENPRP